MDFSGTVTLTSDAGTVTAVGVVAPRIGDAVYDSSKKGTEAVEKIFGPVTSANAGAGLSENGSSSKNAEL